MHVKSCVRGGASVSVNSTFPLSVDPVNPNGSNPIPMFLAPANVDLVLHLLQDIASFLEVQHVPGGVMVQLDPSF